MATLLPSIWGRTLRSGRDPLMDLHREIDRLFDDFHHWPPSVGKLSHGMMSPPAMDMCETAQGLEITAELPGVEENDIELSIEHDELTLRGHKAMKGAEEEKGRRMEERSYGAFQRTIMLPYPCDPSKVQASFENGVLRIMLPKPDEAQMKSHKIPIGKHQAKAGNGGNGGRRKNGEEQGSMGGA